MPDGVDKDKDAHAESESNRQDLQEKRAVHEYDYETKIFPTSDDSSTNMLAKADIRCLPQHP
jgi:hypothetical protein